MLNMKYAVRSDENKIIELIHLTRIILLGGVLTFPSQILSKIVHSDENHISDSILHIQHILHLHARTCPLHIIIQCHQCTPNRYFLVDK